MAFLYHMDTMTDTLHNCSSKQFIANYDGGWRRGGGVVVDGGGWVCWLASICKQKNNKTHKKVLMRKYRQENRQNKNRGGGKKECTKCHLLLPTVHGDSISSFLQDISKPYIPNGNHRATKYIQIDKWRLHEGNRFGYPISAVTWHLEWHKLHQGKRTVAPLKFRKG